MARDEYGLTTNQRAFADEYIINQGNATQAYLKAYPNVKKESTASAGASRLLRNVNVAKYISERTKEMLEAQKMTGDEIIIALVSIARREPKESQFIEYDHLLEETTIKTTRTFQPSIEESTRALETLVRWAGLDSPNRELQNDLLKAHIKKAEAEAEIITHAADKLMKSGQVNDLLKALISAKETGVTDD